MWPQHILFINWYCCLIKQYFTLSQCLWKKKKEGVLCYFFCFQQQCFSFPCEGRVSCFCFHFSPTHWSSYRISHRVCYGVVCFVWSVQKCRIIPDWCIWACWLHNRIGLSTCGLTASAGLTSISGPLLYPSSFSLGDFFSPCQCDLLSSVRSVLWSDFWIYAMFWAIHTYCA